MPNIWYKNKETDTIWWKDDPTVIGVWIFSFDKTTEFNMFHDYPYKLTKEQKQIFDKENPQWADFYNVPLVKTQMKKIIVTAKTLYSHPKNVSKIYAALHTDLAW